VIFSVEFYSPVLQTVRLKPQGNIIKNTQEIICIYTNLFLYFKQTLYWR